MRRFTHSVQSLLVLTMTTGAGCSTTGLFEPSARSVSSTEISGAAAIAVAPNSINVNELAAGEWHWYRDYAFNFNSDEIRAPDENTAREIAEYVKQNPARRIALDGAIERRVLKVRNALVDAGVPAGKVQYGTFGDPNRRRGSRVSVLIGE